MEKLSWYTPNVLTLHPCRVSGPIAGITPQIDHSMHGKFTVHGENGRVINLNPKVITEADVAPPPLEGGEVRKVGRHETVLAPSNDKTDMGRYVT